MIYIINHSSACELIFEVSVFEGKVFFEQLSPPAQYTQVLSCTGPVERSLSVARAVARSPGILVEIHVGTALEVIGRDRGFLMPLEPGQVVFVKSPRVPP